MIRYFSLNHSKFLYNYRLLNVYRKLVHPRHMNSFRIFYDIHSITYKYFAWLLEPPVTDHNNIWFKGDGNIEIEDIWFFRCKIDFYFIEWTPKAVFSRVAKPRVKIPLLVFMSEIKSILHQKKSNFLFLSCLNMEKLTYFIPSAVTTENYLFS